MREKRFDVAVAGCGVARLSAAGAAAEAGARDAELEPAPPQEWRGWWRRRWRRSARPTTPSPLAASTSRRCAPRGPGGQPLRRPVGDLHAGRLLAWPALPPGFAGIQPACPARGTGPRLRPARRPAAARCLRCGLRPVCGDGRRGGYPRRRLPQRIHLAPRAADGPRRRGDGCAGHAVRYARFMAEARAALGLQVGRIGHYARPPAATLAHARAAAGAIDMAEGSFSGGKGRR